MNASSQPLGVAQAYDEYVASVSVRNSKVACWLVIIFMPFGFMLDLAVYPEWGWEFLALRFACSALTGFVLLGLQNERLVAGYHRILCTGWYILPSYFISWMIAFTDGALSTYYAGLNLVILAVSTVIQATFRESLVAMSLVWLMYLVACFVNPLVALEESHAIGSPDWTRAFVNNNYFIFVTVAIVGAGNYAFNKLRFREFCLRQELDENRKSLEAANEELVEMDQLKSRFFANISHELRTPLTLLLAPLEALMHRSGQLNFDTDTRELLGTMHGNGMRLLKLINDLLDLVRLDSGKMELKREPVEIESFLRGLANAVRQVAQDKRVRLETEIAEGLPPAQVDRDKVEKILLNLLFNAIKFTPAGGRVGLRAARDGDDLVLRVSDTGVGIAAEHLPHLFTRFWQADTSSHRKYQGAGIGLALVKELTEAHGGKVSVQSEQGKGTEMMVRLPYVKAEGVAPQPSPVPVAEPQMAGLSAPAPAGAEGAPREEWLVNLYRRAEMFPAMTSLQDTLRPVETFTSSRRQKVLVADDEPDMLRFLKLQLMPYFEVLEAVDGQQAIDKAAQFLPDVIVCDMMMPEKDGLEVCRELRERTSTQNIPIVLLTARADEETKFSALNAGATDFLTKPFSTTELHVRLMNLVKGYQLQRKLARQNQVLESTLEQLKETETQLVQSEKLASLGRLSAGIIHEINNPLNYAKTGLYTLRKKGNQLPEREREDYEEILRDVEDGVTRVSQIVADLRAFTHPSANQYGPVPVEKVVTAALRFLSNELKHNVEVHTDIPPDMVVRSDHNKLTQILINLLQNSVDALKEKDFGEGKATIRIEGRIENGASRLVICDNGPGIKPEVRDKIFDPFFTTKDVGKGMGLGLSICYKLMRDSGGDIQVRTEVGKFCEFTLEFPNNVSQ
ncbi:MAG: ATP-binding protein [Verrucomicrobiota bacterium]